MRQYLELLDTVLNNGHRKDDRTGTGTLSVFGYQMRFDLRKGFPMLTTKKLHIKSIFYELIWFLRGDTDVKFLQEKKVKIWNEWATTEQCKRFKRDEGDLGPIYGHQWRNFGATLRENGTYANDGFDQIKRLIHQIKTNPFSRRLIVTGWNPKEANEVALPPCHTLFQFYVSSDKELSCQLYQRSADIFLGVPFNIVSYSLLTHMIAQMCDLKVGEFIHTIGDAHLYSNHIEQAKIQLEREPRTLPQLKLSPNFLDASVSEAPIEDFIEIVDYEPYPTIKAPIAV